MKFGDIFICRFPFTSGASSKPRPALVLFDLGADAIICRPTSVAIRGSLTCHSPIGKRLDWRNRPSRDLIDW